MNYKNQLNINNNYFINNKEQIVENNIKKNPVHLKITIAMTKYIMSRL